MSKLIIVVSGRKQAGKNTFGHLVAAQFMEMCGVSNVGVDFAAGMVYSDLHVVSGSRLGTPPFTSDDLVAARVEHDLLRNGDLRPAEDEPVSRSISVRRCLPIGPGPEDEACGNVGVRLISFADRLKEFAVEVLGIRPEQAWGSDTEKATHTNILWESLSRDIRRRYAKSRWLPWAKRSGPMTGREVLQVFGTDVCRAMYADCWARATYLKAIAAAEPITVICDARFPNEITWGHFLNASSDHIVKTVRLLRSPCRDSHPSESALDHVNPDDFDLVLGPDRTLNDYRDVVRHWLPVWVRETGLTLECQHRAARFQGKAAA